MGQRLWIPDGEPPAHRGEGSVLFTETAAVIVRCAGFTVLADPAFLDHGDHVHLGYGLTSGTVAEPVVATEPLPHVDFVLLSRLHAEPLDGHLRREIDRRVPILTTPRAAGALRRRGFVAARGLATWETVTIERANVAVRVTAMPGQHRAFPDDFVVPDAMGAMLEFAPSREAGVRLYVSADGLAHEDLRELLQRPPGVDLALFQRGGTRVLAVSAPVDGAARGTALRLVGSRMPAPVPDDAGPETPLHEFAREMRQRGLEAHVDSVAGGDPYVFGCPEPRTPTQQPLESAAGPLEAGDGDVAAAG